MSKKLAAGSVAILLDVTMGDGAFMKDLDGALEPVSYTHLDVYKRQGQHRSDHL